MTYSERTQVLLSPAQRAKVERIAKRNRTSAGAVIREAIDAYDQQAQAAKQTALAALFAVDAPVSDWASMKDEIVGNAS